MMGQHDGQAELFSYQVNLERRIRADHPLRAIRSTIDFTFVREEVAQFYGYNGNESVDPAVIMKLMFVLFFDNVKSERELLRVLPERLDSLWFLGFGLDDEIPDPSVLSKARARWGQAVFESLFVRTVQQCVAAGLVDGTKLHVDGSLVDANASRDAVMRSGPELIDALKRAFQVEEQKFERVAGAPRPINATLCSTTDPDAPCIRNSKVGASGDTRPRYKQHRAVDDRCGVITATVTTGGHVAEPAQTVPLIEQHNHHTGCQVETVVGDQQYGTIDNHRTLQRRGLRTHLKTLPGPKRDTGRFSPEDFAYDQALDRYRCPAGEWLYPRRFDAERQHTQYTTRKGFCAGCPLKPRCTTSQYGRELNRYLEHDLVLVARTQARSSEARKDYRRRRHLMEGSFAQSANAHGPKRARWRRLWRQQIQDWLIAGCVNLKLLIGALRPAPQPTSAGQSTGFAHALAQLTGLCLETVRTGQIFGRAHLIPL